MVLHSSSSITLRLLKGHITCPMPSVKKKKKNNNNNNNRAQPCRSSVPRLAQEELF